MLAYTGCPISEALALTADRIDLKDGAIVIESAKKRQRGVYRPVPVPPAFLDMVHTPRPRGLRDGFGIRAVTCGVPLNTLQQLFGYAQLSTTSYTPMLWGQRTPVGGADVSTGCSDV